ncbi:2-phospho-L-lactate guanylyltransferase [Natrinema caseinilyticum]|uniref:2-phospho-L-lactate guanylyltransferase n=1 Tax=Natrinema caseinilyticum TaxID=2961570 RepID=UPI0020C316C8|nr:2-phospho-L-lactate guanylyltransferase [Natrinema caseinilyticum]
MRVLIPFDPRKPKTRLGGVLSADERRAFAEAMLRDVLGAVRNADATPLVLSTAEIELDGVSVRVDERPLSPAVNAYRRETTGPLCVLLADLPLVTCKAIDRLLEPAADIVIAPGLGGGTNALAIRHPDFRVDYHGSSYLDHRDAARAVGASVATVDSFRLGVDVDEPADIVEVLLHGSGRADAWLRDAGFRLDSQSGRVTAVRISDEMTA